MSTITSATASQGFNPLARLQSELASQVSAGSINSADQSSLSSALKEIDSAMKSNKPSEGSGPPSPDEMQSKINDLISQQVSDGKLTSDQAEELKSVFANAMKGGPGGPPPGPPPSDSESTDTTSTSSTSSSDSDVAKVLSDFLKSLQDSQESSGYGSDGDSLVSQLQSLIVNYQA